MRLADSPEEAAWREEVQQFLRDNLAPELRRRSTAGEDAPEHGKALDKWRTALSGRGWVAPAWPKEYGGAGLSIMDQFIMDEEFAEAGAPQLGGMGVSMVGPTLIAHGTDEQRAEHLPRILRGEVHWCQGFSEPGTGSDLASLQTRAVRDGDDYVINGEKIWTSGAHHANWMFMLVRTDPDAPKHRGISFLLVDFTTPGITVQPLVNMGDGLGFNQVFFDDVRVPARNLVGDENRGWYVGTTTLDFERSGIGSSVNTRKNVNNLLTWAREHRDDPACTVARNPVVRMNWSNVTSRSTCRRCSPTASSTCRTAGLIPNAEASLTKLFTTELIQRICRTSARMGGMYGQIWDLSRPTCRSAASSRALT